MATKEFYLCDRCGRFIEKSTASYLFPSSVVCVVTLVPSGQSALSSTKKEYVYCPDCEVKIIEFLEICTAKLDMVVSVKVDTTELENAIEKIKNSGKKKKKS